MSTLKELVYQNGWAKVEMESIIFPDGLQFESVECYFLPIYYIKIGDGRICKIIASHDIDDGYRCDILDEERLGFDSWMVECRKRVIDDKAEYADSFLNNPQIRIIEPGKVYYDKTSLCDSESLPIDVIRFIREKVNCEYAM